MTWLKNSNGSPDAVLTMTFIGFIIVMIKVLFAGFAINVAGREISVGTIDAATIGAILAPTFTAYVSRRWTDKKFENEESKE
jgi:hypothetical protein